MARLKIDPSLLFYAALIKAYEGTTLRRTIGKVKLVFGDQWWDENGFHYNRFSDYFNDRGTTEALNWANAEVCAPFMPLMDTIILDGTGISLTTRGTYRSERYPESVDFRYARLTLAMEPRFKVFPVAIVTPERGVGTGEVSQVSPLLRRLKALGWCAEYVLADALYGGENVFETIVDDYGAQPVIPLKRIYSATKLPTTPFMRRIYKQFLADPEAFHERYRFRPLVECGISALKRKFEGCVRARTPRAQMNEILFKVLCHNIDCLIHAAYENGLNIEHMLGKSISSTGSGSRDARRLLLSPL